MEDSRIETVVASAGTGKTTRIVNEISVEVTRREPEQIVATTFTVKAADELIERARANLFKTGLSNEAARLLGARFGTVNAICGQIVGEHAIDLGRSPRVEVIPEEESHASLPLLRTPRSNVMRGRSTCWRRHSVSSSRSAQRRLRGRIGGEQCAG